MTTSTPVVTGPAQALSASTPRTRRAQGLEGRCCPGRGTMASEAGGVSERSAGEELGQLVVLDFDWTV